MKEVLIFAAGIAVGVILMWLAAASTYEPSNKNK